jgi:hypothetical protein
MARPGEDDETVLGEATDAVPCRRNAVEGDHQVDPPVVEDVVSGDQGDDPDPDTRRLAQR